MKTFICIALLGATMTSIAAEEPALSPALFVDQVGQGGLTEMALGELALKKSQSPAVQEFARLMIEHHDKATVELATIARAKGIEPPMQPDSMHAALIQALDTEEGASFDHVYAQRMNAYQAQTIALFESATRSTDADLAQFAQSALPALKANRAKAKKLAKLAR
jgi:putative membrane protein